LISQLANLERRTGRSGRDSVDHRTGEHDDVANSVAGAIVHARSAVKPILGYIAYAKKAAANLFALPSKTNPAPSSTSTTMMAHPPIQAVIRPDSKCEMCGEKTAIAKCSGRWRCNACGFQWGDVLVMRPITRGDFTSGRHKAHQYKYPGQP
jgi:ribosomal protein S27AE